MNVLHFVGIILAIIIIFVMCFSSAPPKYHSGDVVECSRFFEITDMYKTPGPVYHATLSGGIALKITSEEYSTWKKGNYLAWMPGYKPIRFIQLNETETGYRNACQVV